MLQVASLLEANATLQTSLQWQEALIANSSVRTYNHPLMLINPWPFPSTQCFKVINTT